MLPVCVYTAPEVVNFDPLCLATDMWSVGVIAFILWVLPSLQLSIDNSFLCIFIDAVLKIWWEILSLLMHVRASILSFTSFDLVKRYTTLL